MSERNYIYALKPRTCLPATLLRFEKKMPPKGKGKKGKKGDDEDIWYGVVFAPSRSMIHMT